MIARPVPWIPSFSMEVAKGLVTGHSFVHKFGRNDTVGATWELVANLSVATTFLSAATTIRIKAGGNAADTSAGTGARSVTIIGLNENYREISETITTNGISASTSSTETFTRVYRAFVATCGDYDNPFNVGDITIENTAGTQDLIMIKAEEGQSQHGAVAAPTGVKVYLLSAQVSVDSNQTADFRLMTRESINTTTAPVQSQRVRHYWDGVSGVAPPYRPETPDWGMPGPCDIWMEAQGSPSAECTADFELMMVED